MEFDENMDCNEKILKCSYLTLHGTVLLCYSTLSNIYLESHMFNEASKDTSYLRLQKPREYDIEHISILTADNNCCLLSCTSERGILFLFTDSSGDKKPVLILRDFSIYILNIDCHFEYYRNSIFDVTIHNGKIVIYDAIYISGIKINTYEFIDRITEAENFKKNTYNPIFDVCEYFTEISTLIESIIPYEEEIFIISNNFPNVVGINRGCFKWQPSEYVYISLKVEEIQSDMLLYATNYKKEVSFAKIHSSDEHGKLYIDNIKKLDKYKNGCVIDICFENNEEKIKILRVSDNFPASIRYIEKLLHSKKENITKHDFIK